MLELHERYELEGLLGQGSFAKIYLAKEKSSGDYFAVKFTDKTKTKPKHYMREIEVIEKLSKYPHPNIIWTKEIIQDETNLFIVQEYLAHGNLLCYMSKNAPLTENQVQRIFRPIASAIYHLHVHGIAHRDIKLENILMSSDGTPKIIDFNLSCFWTNDTPLQRSFCGSQEYCAPEIFLRVPYRGPEVDVWSLGVLLYAMLFCEFPFKPQREEKHEPGLQLNPNTSSLSYRVINCLYNLPERHFVSAEAIALVKSILVYPLAKRPTVSEILSYQWFQDPVVEAHQAEKEDHQEVVVEEVAVLHANHSQQEKEQMHEEWLKDYYHKQFRHSVGAGVPQPKNCKVPRRNTTLDFSSKKFKQYWAKIFRVGRSLQLS